MSINVKRAFVVADRMKIVEERRDNEFPFDLLERETSAVCSLPEHLLDEIIGKDPVRLSAFDDLNWLFVPDADISMLRVYDQMGGRSWGFGSVSEVAERFRTMEEQESRIWRMVKWAPTFALELPS